MINIIIINKSDYIIVIIVSVPHEKLELGLVYNIALSCATQQCDLTHMSGSFHIVLFHEDKDLVYPRNVTFTK